MKWVVLAVLLTGCSIKTESKDIVEYEMPHAWCYANPGNLEFACVPKAESRKK